MEIRITGSLTRPDGQKITGTKILKYLVMPLEENLSLVVNLKLYSSEKSYTDRLPVVNQVNDFDMRQYVNLTSNEFLALNPETTMQYIFNHMEPIVGVGKISIS